MTLITAVSSGITSNLRPPFSALKAEYEKYKFDKQPCKYGYKNQCAIRLSLALSRCGMTFERFGAQRRIHRGRSACKLGNEPHIVGAEELKAFLDLAWGVGMMNSPDVMKAVMQGRTGVVYFNNCFKREKTDTSFKGDHIDLWTGDKYYNQILAIGAGGDARASADLFSRADSVQFFHLV